MTPAEYAEAVDYIEDWWGISNAWVGAVRLAPDFADLDTDAVYEVLMARQSGDPEKAKYPPRPAELRALTLERMRHTPPADVPALPEATSGSPKTWREWSMETYGEVLPIIEAVQRRAEELANARA